MKTILFYKMYFSTKWDASTRVMSVILSMQINWNLSTIFSQQHAIQFNHSRIYFMSKGRQQRFVTLAGNSMNSIGYVKKNEDKARKTTRGFLRYKTSYSYNTSTHPNANYFFSSIFGGNFSYMFFFSAICGMWTYA